jgi:PTH2 family peptidyl-tRNA hydrolase
MNVKQVIVIRKDLNMRKGKMVAQGAHASMKVFFDRIVARRDDEFLIEVTGEMKEWVDGIFTKVCVSVDSEDELLLLNTLAQTAGLPCALIQDAGLTEFGGVPTFTALAIGPADASKINEITGNLKLL